MRTLKNPIMFGQSWLSSGVKWSGIESSWVKRCAGRRETGRRDQLLLNVSTGSGTQPVPGIAAPPARSLDAHVLSHGPSHASQGHLLLRKMGHPFIWGSVCCISGGLKATMTIQGGCASSLTRLRSVQGRKRKDRRVRRTVGREGGAEKTKGGTCESASQKLVSHAFRRPKVIIDPFFELASGRTCEPCL